MNMSDPLLALAHGLLLWSSCLVLIAWLGVRKIPIIAQRKA
jgi:hypothetical protein